MGLSQDIPPNELAVVVTFLEMRQRPAVVAPPSPLQLRQMGADLDAYRALFRRVGARWLWFSRLVMPDARLAAILGDPAVERFAVVDRPGNACGLLELDFRVASECELVFVALVPELAGHGHGRWLLAEALRLAWREGVRRVHLHTCTLDHPAALPAYLRAGFIVTGRAVESFPDPRLLRVLPADCAPQVPLLGTLAGALPAATSCK